MPCFRNQVEELGNDVGEKPFPVPLVAGFDAPRKVAAAETCATAAESLTAWWEEYGKTIPAKPSARGLKPNDSSVSSNSTRK